MILHIFWTFNALQSGEHVWQNGEISLTYIFFFFKYLTVKRKLKTMYISTVEHSGSAAVHLP